MENQNTQKGLDRYLSPLDVWSMTFGCMIGWGAFVMPGTTFLPVAGPAGTVIALLIGMGVMLILSVSFSYLMTRSTRRAASTLIRRKPSAEITPFYAPGSSAFPT